MHAHESQAPGFQPQGGVNQAKPLAPRPFEVTFPGQELPAAPTNPFVQRSANAWAAPPAPPSPVAPTPPPEGETDTQDVQLDWRPQFNLFAEGQSPPNPPRRWDIQAKLTIGRPNDAYEQEADRVAEQVMTMPAPVQRLQRQSDLGAEETEDIQTKPLAETITPLIQRQELPEDETPVQTKCEACEEETVQRSPNGVPQVQTNLEERLSASKGGGSPLSEDVRSFMEPRFGADFSQVRVHTGGDAVQMSRDVRAQAFTHGHDIYFGPGKAPGLNDLTAHELTHVIQQKGAKRLSLQRKVKPNKSAESELQDNALQQTPPNQTQSLLNPADQAPKSDQPANPNQSAINFQPSPAQEAVKSPGTPQAQPAAAPQASPAVAAPATSDASGKLEVKPQPDAVTPAKPEGVNQLDAKAKPEGANKSESGPAGAGANATPTNQPQPAPLPAAATPTVEAIATQVGGAVGGGQSDVGGAAAGGQAPAIDAGGGEGGDAGAEPAAADPELEAIAAHTEGVTLESGDQAAAQAATAEIATVGEGGGEAAGGGGGGGGAAIPDPPTPPVPDVANAEPAQALATIGQLPPAQLQAGLSGVTAAVGSTVGQQRAELAAKPPQMERPSGSPVNKAGAGGDKLPAGGDKAPKAVEKAPTGAAKPVPPPKPVTLPPPPPIPAAAANVKGDADGKLSAGDAQALQSSVRQMPTSDPGLNVKAETPPPLELKGDADPNQAQEQKAKLEKSLADTQTQGQQEMAQPMGEQDIYPSVPQETLTAEVGGGGAASGGAVAPPVPAAGGGQGAEGGDAVSIVAQQQHGQAIQAAVAQAQGQMAAQKQDHVLKVSEEKEKSNKEINKLQTDNANEQAQERAKAQAEVTKQRADWNKEQTALLDKSRKDSDAAVAKGMQDVQKEQTQAETKATEHIEQGNQEAEQARRKGEEDAAAEKQKAEKDSGGIFGWLADKAKSFFDGIKQAIHKAFELARAAVKAAIDTAKKLATAVIEAARTAIVAIIKTVGDALIAIGDVLLAAFPEMRDRFRNAIKSVVQKAEATVNALADKLKQGVQAALNLLGKGLDAALGLLEKGYMMAIDIASKAVQGAISAAKAVVDAIGAFAALIKDIAGNPGQWLSNLAAAAMDGVRNHLWSAFQVAVKEWFNQKVEEVLGLGLTVWNVLSKGGIKLDEIGKMAWEGIKAAIPPALIQILIEKVVAMIIPAAGAVMAIIEGLQAAWGTVSRILQAMEKFMAFLKAVKSGQAGPQFGQLLAAAGVILIDFVANWLLKRVRKAASKVASKIKEIAKKIGDKLKGAFAKIKKKAGGFKDKLFGTKGDKRSKDTSKKSPKSTKDKEKNDLEKKQKKVDRAVAVATSAVNAFAGKPVGKFVLTPILEGIKRTFGLKTLEPIQDGDNWTVYGEINPTSRRKTKAKVDSKKTKRLEEEEPTSYKKKSSKTKKIKEKSTETKKLKQFEVVDYKTSTTRGRGRKGDRLTGDHIPSRAALVEAQERKLKRRLTKEERASIKDSGVTVVLTDKYHKKYSRTYGGRNTADQIRQDARNLNHAFGKDTEAILRGLHKDGKLTKEHVLAYQQAFNENLKIGNLSSGKKKENLKIKKMLSKFLKAAT